MEGTEFRSSALSAADVVFDARQGAFWESYALHNSVAIVNVVGAPPPYQEFWAHCSFSRPPAFTAFVGAEGVGTTCFSHYDLAQSPGAGMICVCDCDAFRPSRRPAFFGHPECVLQYIEQYVDRFDLQQQANEALQIAMLWPTICRFECHISLPRPLHTADWLSRTENPGSDPGDTVFEGLRSSEARLTLASALACEWSLACQVYDVMTLAAAKQSGDELEDRDVGIALSWLTRHLSAPGVGWSFLLRHHFHVSPSFLRLTGLYDEPVHWARLLGQGAWSAAAFPAHLRLLQAFWVPTSASCKLPWHPSSFRCSPGLPSAGPMGPINPSSAQFAPRDLVGGVEVPVAGTFQGGRDVGRLSVALAAQGHWVQLSASAAPEHAFAGSPRAIPSRGGILLGNHRRIDGEEDVLRFVPLDDALEVDLVASEAAAAAAADAMRCIEIRGRDVLDKAWSELAAEGVRRYGSLDPLGTGACVEEGKYVDTLASSTTGWECALVALRTLRQDNHSMASLLRQLQDVIGTQVSSREVLPIQQLAGVCAVLELPIASLGDMPQGLEMTLPSSVAASKDCSLHLWRSERGWCLLDETSKGGVASRCSSQSFPIQQAAPKAKPHAPDVGDSPADAPRSPPPVPSTSNLASRVRLLDDAIRQWDWATLDAKDVCDIHLRLFPTASLPRFLQSECATRTAPHGLCKGDPGNDHCREAARVVASFLDQVASVPVLRRERHSFALDAALCRARWPHRSTVNSGKNNISVHGLLELFDLDKPQEALATWFILSRSGNHAEFVASVALWLSAVSLCAAAWKDLFASPLMRSDEDRWLQDCQLVHNGWRKNGLPTCPCDHCWAQLLYPQALWGRGGVEVDWCNEISGKAAAPDPVTAYNGVAWSRAFASETIQQAVSDVLETALPRLAIEPLDAFLDRAYEWLVGGSVAGFPSAFKGTDVRAVLLKEYKLNPRPTKRSVMEKIPREHIREQLRKRPQIVAKLHQKMNETGGKARAIYGVTLWHYIFSNWLMSPFEMALDHPNIDINIPGHHFMQLQMRRSRGAGRQACFSSYDYPDFNSMHTHSHMSMIYAAAKAIAQRSRSFLACDRADQQIILEGYDWLFESVYTQVCYLPSADRFIQTVGGLYSGNRDTTLINTLLNVAYAKVVDVSCTNMCVNPRVDWRLCHGDDIITQHSSYAAALAWNTVAEKANLKGQEKKLLTDRSYHEYLRVMGCKDGKLRGSLARAVATFVCGNWETDHMSSMHAKVVELENSLATLGRRGMRKDLLSRLRRTVLARLQSMLGEEQASARAMRAVLSSLARAGAAVPANTSVSNTSEALSGVFEEAVVHSGKDSFPLKRKNDVERLYLDLPAEVTQPYIRYLRSLVPSHILLPSNFETRLKLVLQRSTYGSELPLRYQVDVEQLPQLVHLARLREEEATKRGRFPRFVELGTVGRLLQSSRPTSRVMQRIKALHALIQVLDHTAGYSDVALVAELCDASEATVSNALQVLAIAKADWRRCCRPSAPDVCGVENETETALACQARLWSDEEVVLVCDDHSGRQVAVRDQMLY